MPVTENRRVAEEMLAAMGSNDVDVLDRLLAPNVQQWIPESSTTKAGIDNPTVGAESVKALFARGPLRYEYLRYETLFMVADENGAAAFTQTNSRLRDGREFRNRYALFFRIQDGRITEIWEHPDTALMFEFFGL